MEIEASTGTLDRRQRRRLQTIEEVLDVAAELMREQGVAGLSIGEVARRMGIRPPSLYVYFDSKNTLYDALFERGANLIADEMRAFGEQLDPSLQLEDSLLAWANAFVRWTVEHPEYAQLLFWRPVPGFAPSERAYAPALRLVDMSRERFTELQQRGLLRADIPLDDIQRDWTIVISGITSQQLANAPDEPFESGSFTSAIPRVVAMFANQYAPTQPARRARHANER